MRSRTRIRFIVAACIVLAVGAPAVSRAVDLPVVPQIQSIDSGPAVHHDTSPPLRDIPPNTDYQGCCFGGNDTGEAMPQRRAGNGFDPVLQKPTMGPVRLAPTPSANFVGIGVGGPAGFSVSSAPPDTNSAVGPNHVVEIVNSAFAVFNKSGSALYGPVNTNTLWSGFGGLCQSDNDGDGVVRYDSAANRFFITQFAVSGATTTFYECIAVSTTADPTGSYYRYAFSYSGFPDYPKVGIWPDAYYVTYNMFNAAGTAFLGAQACAMNRANMLTGAAATQQCFTTSTAYGGVMPSDFNGGTAPPAGEPNLMVALGTSSTTLAYWKFHVDWTTPTNSTFAGPTNLTVASYTQACSGGTCVPQSGTTNKLDSLADRVMFPMGYRNFGDHESLVLSHSVTAGSSTGIRWYEFRLSGGNPTVYQQGTYAPDATYRWMSSAAIDQNGDIALGYSTSSSSAHPGISYTARLVGDALGTMTQGEGTFIVGGGSQTGTLTRWGDYASLSVDPADGCTFWYSTEYINANGTFNWSTRIGAFKLASCGLPPPNDFSMSASPSSGTVTQGNSTTSTISTTTTSGAAQTVSFSATGLPSGASASFSPTSVTSGASSTMTITTAGSTPAGTYPITVTGTGTSATHTTSYSLTVNAVVANDFSISASPTSGSVTQGSSAITTITTATTSGAAQTVNLSASGLPSGASAAFAPSSVTSGAQSTLTISTAGSTPAGTYSITITGTGTSATHTTSYSLTVTATGGSGVSNGGFETGSFSGWTTVNVTSITTATPHAGTYAGQAGATTPTNGDSNIVQTFTVPSGFTTLSFWYSMSCPDTVTYDWATATLTDNTTATTTTPLAKTCATGSWIQKTAAVTAGHSYTLTMTSHDDNYASDPSYTKFDDVVLTAPPSNPILNPGFETGSLASWTSLGTTSVTTATPHSGSYAGQAGASTPTNGDSSVAQTFTAPAGSTTLTFWYSMSCPDTVTYDWATATLRDNTTATTATVLAKTCATGSWIQKSASVIAGHSYTLTLISHDDNYASDPSYTKFDDAVVS